VVPDSKWSQRIIVYATYFDTVGGSMHLQKSWLQSAVKQEEEEEETKEEEEEKEEVLVVLEDEDEVVIAKLAVFCRF